MHQSSANVLLNMFILVKCGVKSVRNKSASAAYMSFHDKLGRIYANELVNLYGGLPETWPDVRKM